MVFKEVERTSRNEDESKLEKGPKKMEFEKNNEGSYSLEEEESSKLEDEVEPQILALRKSNHVRRSTERYIPPNFHYAFFLSSINDEPRFVKEAVNSEEGKLLKRAMVEEMEAFYKNETWDLVKFPNGRKPISSK